MTRWLETDSLSNQNIASGLAIGAYTADADRLILCQFFADQVAGNGDYDFWLTHQIAGSGSSYRYVPKTTATVASGVTAIAGQSIMVAVRSGDVLTAYLDGLAGDTTTPDTTVRWFEMAALRPATADRTLAVAATGEAAANVTLWAGVAVAAADADGMIKVDAEKWTGLWLDEFSPGVTAFMDEGNTITSQRIRDAMKLAPTAGDPAAGSVDAHLDAVAAALATVDGIVDDILVDTGTTIPGLLAGVGSGSGTGYYSDTVDDGTSPLDGVRVQLYTAADRVGLAYEAYTNALGVFEMWPDTGTYYRWLDLAGYSFTQDVEVEVTEP